MWRTQLHTLFLVTALGLAGCVGTVPEHVRTKAVQGELTNTPFYPQKAFHCGPAALATTLGTEGITVHPDRLAPHLFVPRRKGSFQIEMLAATRHYGALPYRIHPDFKSIMAELEAGHPVLVLQNLGLGLIPVWHYAVVVGYEPESKMVVLRSGTEKRHITPRALFERTWRRARNWGIVIVRPGRLPATAEAAQMLRLVLILEQKKKWHDAQAFYRAMTIRWPKHVAAWMGAGNSAYALGDRHAARMAFGEVIKIDARHAAAHNNLAHVLMEAGDLSTAHRHALLAVKLGGPQIEVYRSTLTQINRQRRQQARMPRHRH